MQIFLRYARSTTELPNNFVTKAYDCRLLFILKGTGKILIQDKEFDIKENTICYYPSGTRYLPVSTGNFPMEFITLNFDFDHTNKHISKAMPPAKESEFIESKSLVPNYDILPEMLKYPFVFENAIEYRDDFLKLTTEFSEDTPFGKEKAEAKLQYLLLSIATSPLKNNADIFSDTMSYIKNNLFTILTNEEIAKALNYHSYYLNKIFKEKTGTSMHQYIVNERLKTAADLLSTTTMNVSNVAKTTGFKNIRHFSTAFSKKYKCTPSAMRQRRNIFI